MLLVVLLMLVLLVLLLVLLWVHVLRYRRVDTAATAHGRVRCGWETVRQRWRRRAWALLLVVQTSKGHRR